VDSTGEFNPGLDSVADVHAVDDLVLDCAVLDDVDYVPGETDTDYYSGSRAKAHPFTGGMKPTTGNLFTPPHLNENRI
jgi:hypothetical protein